MNKKLGIYVHIPFCRAKCSYCDFYSVTGSDNLFGAYSEALKTHIREAAEQLAECEAPVRRSERDCEEVLYNRKSRDHV
jgi:coproporphyrinogen III oxidase-like Fe-S oxidoreductase